MNTMSKSIHSAPVVLSVLALVMIIALFAHADALAQTSSPGETDIIHLTVSPKHPRPGQTVTISLSSPSIDTDRALISWSHNGVAATSGIGLKQFSLRVGDTGAVDTVDVTIEGIDGTVVQETLTLRPADVLLLWQANTYTPPFYRGKALHVAEGTLAAVAIPNIVNNGVRVPANQLVFTWKRDDVVLGSQSGTGRDRLALSGSVLSRPIDVSVTVETLDGTVQATRALRIPIARPLVQLYINDPLLGVLFERALRDTVTLSGEETVVETFPYFFSTTNRHDALAHEWRIGGSRLTTEEDVSVTLRRTEATGRTTLSAGVTNPPYMLESADKTITIEF